MKLEAGFSDESDGMNEAPAQRRLVLGQEKEGCPESWSAPADASCLQGSIGMIVVACITDWQKRGVDGGKHELSSIIEQVWGRKWGSQPLARTSPIAQNER